MKSFKKLATILVPIVLISCTPTPVTEVIETATGTGIISITIPTSHELEFPFAAQAPFADWTDPRQQEGCEEMSVIMVHHYLNGTTLNNQTAFEELMAISDWEEEHGYLLDVSVTEMEFIVEEYYEGYEAEVIEGADINRMKKEISSGNPIIIPAAGRLLHNPNFSGEGPFYHMLVVTGYTPTHFITNDPGTRRGEDYEYSYDVLMKAIHDWTGVKEETHLGEQRMLVIRKK